MMWLLAKPRWLASAVLGLPHAILTTVLAGLSMRTWQSLVLGAAVGVGVGVGVFSGISGLRRTEEDYADLLTSAGSLLTEDAIEAVRVAIDGPNGEEPEVVLEGAERVASHRLDRARALRAPEVVLYSFFLLVALGIGVTISPWGLLVAALVAVTLAFSVSRPVRLRHRLDRVSKVLERPE